MNIIEGALRPLIDKSINFHDTNFIAIAGDMNFLTEGEGYMEVGATEYRLPPVLSPSSRRWQGLCSQLVQTKQPMPTHFNKAHGLLGTIDRIWVSVPRWNMELIDATMAALQAPTQLSKSGISDHAPVVVSFLPREPTPPGTRAIPKHILESPEFKEILHYYFDEVDFEQLDPPEAYRVMVNCMQAAGRLAREAMGAEAYPKTQHRLKLLTSVARAVAAQDRKLAAMLIRTCPLAAHHLHFQGRQVCLTNTSEFNRNIEWAKQNDINGSDCSEGQERQIAPHS